jgi:hypothetical protein
LFEMITEVTCFIVVIFVIENIDIIIWRFHRVLQKRALLLWFSLQYFSSCFRHSVLCFHVLEREIGISTSISFDWMIFHDRLLTTSGTIL